jgi:hypothetical protein
MNYLKPQLAVADTWAKFTAVSKPSSSANSNEPKNTDDGPSLYERFLAIREDVLRHKWLKSEEAGEDVGFEAALVDYMENHLDEEKADETSS